MENSAVHVVTPHVGAVLSHTEALASAAGICLKFHFNLCLWRMRWLSHGANATGSMPGQRGPACRLRVGHCEKHGVASASSSASTAGVCPKLNCTAAKGIGCCQTLTLNKRFPLKSNTAWHVLSGLTRLTLACGRCTTSS